MRACPIRHAIHRALVGALLILAAVPSFSQTYRTGAVGGVLWVQPTPICASNADTWYGPTLYTLPNGNLAFLAQAGRWPGSSCPVQSAIDSLYGAVRSGTGVWTTPSNAAATCANVVGAYRRCGYSYTTSPDGKIHDPGPVGNPSVIKVGTTYYMIFNGGNADYLTGKLYWAMSSDGSNWSVYNVSPPSGQLWTPLIGSRYHDCDEKPGVSEGIGEAALAYDASDTSGGPNGTFYVYFNDWYDPANGLVDTWAFRFGYDPANPFGLGGNRQIWHQGVWKPSSGSLIWRYDIDAGKPGDPSEPTLGVWEGQNSGGAFGFGGGDLKQDPVTGQWLHVFLDISQQSTWSQTATSLRDNLWSSPVAIDMGTVKASYPGNYTDGNGHPVHIEYEAGLWFGATGNRTGWWLYDPVNFMSCAGAYVGLGIAPVELCSGGAPTIATITPTSGPSAGGTSVHITGTGLDCVSSVTFGGAAATVVVKGPLDLTVTAPSHAAGGVSVAVTTPAGAATLPNGFTYTGPPAYEGFHESLDCNYAVGWAWDSNRPNDPINVNVYDGTTLLGSTPANGFRQDLVNAGKGNGYHGFAFSLPVGVRNGSAHSISVRFENTATNLTWSPRSVTCRSLSVSKAGTGVGTVTSNPVGVSCGGDCSESYPVNTAVTLTAAPGSGSTFSGWSGDADCSDGAVTLSASRSCTATFAAAVRVIWMQPQASAGFGTPGSLVMAGSATNAPSGTSVRVTWRDVTAGGPWTTEPYQPVPDANGTWYHEILNAVYSHQYAVTATFGATTSPTCTYSGSGTLYWCP